ncbi:hypothetical protein GCM10010495_61730 [Kitasatospora herbaricolor]|uniref:hypothetical protein n=1 Tax=Kitasatospora herbaricolor TaxID=68217 RepID=UPI0017492B59|nr:hypothetical protein [Kitasatospora herbaricolor]MDQ0312801.1 hypothetical protein [Kitasatospora herbaricolor]GGV36233.1 hypothetical protein GCM10010495_61730 [Kitasatospora herbaricolor]
MRKLSVLGAVVAGFAAALAMVAPASAAGPSSWVTANSDSTGDQDTSSIAANRLGDVAVVWEDDRDSTAPADDAHSDVWVRMFRNGVSAYESKLSAGGTAGVAWRHLQPDVGLDDRGNAVVVWAEDPDGNGFYNIVYRVLSPAGAVLGSGRANANSDGQQIHPRVAVDPDGAPGSTGAVAFSVVWEDIQGTAAATVKAAGFTGTTTKAYEVTVNATGGAHHNPDVATSASGDAVVVWDDDTDNNGSYQIGLVKLAKANGAVALTRRSANSFAGGQQQRPAVAADFNGDFAVAWESDHTGTRGVWARSFTAAGTAGSAEVEISAGPGAGNPTVGIDDQRDAVVGWSVAGTDPAVRARGLNPDGTFAGRLPAQSVSQVTTGRQEQAAVASSPFGALAISYTDDNDGNSFDQVLLSLGATNSDW